MTQVSPFAVFKNRSFTLMWSAQLISTFGDSLTQLAAGILVFRLTGSALAVGLMFAVTMLPTLLVGLVAGVYVDRWDRKTILVASCFIQALFVALIPLMLPLGVVWLYVLVALSSTVRQFYDPANSSVQPDIVGDEALESANSLLSVSATASQILGFAAAGFLATQTSLGWVFWLDALTFVVAGCCLLGISVPRLEESDGEDVRTILSDLRSGVVHYLNTPVLLTLAGINLLFGFLVAGSNTATLPFVLTVLSEGSEFVLGLQESVQAAGYVLASLAMAALAARFKPRVWIVLSLVGMASVYVLYALNDNLPFAIILMALLGVFNAPILIASKTLFQRNIPSPLRGRVFGTFFVCADAVAILGALAGGLGDVIGLRLLLAVFGVLVGLLGLLAGFLPALSGPPEVTVDSGEAEQLLAGTD